MGKFKDFNPGHPADAIFLQGEAMNKPDDERLGRWTRWSWWLSLISVLTLFALWLLFSAFVNVWFGVSPWLPQGYGIFGHSHSWVLTVFWIVLIAVVAVPQLISLGMGMRVARHRPRALWWVAPQMSLVLSLLGILNVWMLCESWPKDGWLTQFRDERFVLVAVFSAIVGAIAVTVWWTRWVLAKSAAERWRESVAAESRRLEEERQ